MSGHLSDQTGGGKSKFATRWLTSHNQCRKSSLGPGNHPLAVTGQALLHRRRPQGWQACMGLAMDELWSIDPAFVPAKFAAAFGPALAGMLWRSFHTETICALRRPAPTVERRCSNNAAAALCNSELSSENRRGTVLKRTTRTVAIIAALTILSAGAASSTELKVLSGGADRKSVV